MEGFSLIPKKEIAEVSMSPTQSTKSAVVGSEMAFAKDVRIKEDRSYLSIAAIALAFFSIGFILYIVGMRFIILSQIDGLSNQLVQLESNINKQDIADLKTIDQRLSLIRSRLSQHTLNFAVLDVINQSLRKSVQVTEYKLESTDVNLIITISMVAPSFKDMAEQTDRMFGLKSKQLISAFSITNMSYEQDTRRVRFTMKINLDKSRYSAMSANISTQ